jgi:hypothetical protein
VGPVTYVDIARVTRIFKEDDVCQGKHKSNKNAEEGKSADTRGPSSLLLEDDGESGEEHLTKKR